MLTRTFRFILPVLVVTALLWGLGASNATKDSQPAGMQPAGWPYWYQISSFAGYVTVVFNCVRIHYRENFHFLGYLSVSAFSAPSVLGI